MRTGTKRTGPRSNKLMRQQKKQKMKARTGKRKEEKEKGRERGRQTDTQRQTEPLFWFWFSFRNLCSYSLCISLWLICILLFLRAFISSSVSDSCSGDLRHLIVIENAAFLFFLLLIEAFLRTFRVSSDCNKNAVLLGFSHIWFLFRGFVILFW